MLKIAYLVKFSKQISLNHVVSADGEIGYNSESQSI